MNLIKKSTMLAGLVILSLTTFSQTATNKSIDTCKITLTCETARKVAVDLLRGDSAKAELVETNRLLKLTEDKVQLKDSTITSYVVKTNLHRQEIDLYKSKEEIYKEMVFKLQKESKRSKLIIQIMGIAVGALTATTIICFAR